MPYRVRFTDTAGRIVANFHPELKKITRIALQEIARNPYLGKELQEELGSYLSYRFKRYRAVYTVDEKAKIIVIHLVGHRRNVYELLEKLIPAPEIEK